jgi:hypothetical protein
MQGLHRARAGAFACALGLVVWSCSSDSRDFGEGDQLGAGGDGGEAPGIGAGGTDATVNGGAAAATTGGTVAEAGGGSQSEGLSVVSTSPEDAAVGAERDVVVQVTFSAAIDADSITAESFVVTGPGGPVSGQRSVDGATVTFTSSAPWSLLADYVVDVAETVADTDANELGAAYQFSFQSRDGVFRKPERLTTQTTINLNAEGNRAGHVVASWSDGAQPASSFAVFFDPATGSWGEPAALETDATNDYTYASVALNEAGEAFVVTGNATGAWNRAAGGVWGTASAAGVTERRDGALADDGTAMTVWESIVGNDWRCSAASLSPDDKWSATTVLQNKARSWGVVRYGSGFMAFQAHDPNAQMFSRVFDVKEGWLAAKPITPADSGANYVSYQTLAPQALFTWNGANGRMQASLFDGESWATEELGPVAGGTNSSVGPKGHLATWLYNKNAYAARYDVKSGWADPITLGATSAEDYGPGAAVDDAGNALAVWPEGTSISWRRSPHGSLDWLDAQQIKDQDPGIVISKSAASGEIVVVWSNPLGLWASRFE